MSDARTTAWTRMESEHDYWQRWTVDAWESVRMLAFEARGGWTFAVDAFRGLAHGRVYDPWDHEDGEIEARPVLPTRELAQAAAEEWVAKWAAGLLEAVGAGGDEGDAMAAVRADTTLGSMEWRECPHGVVCDSPLGRVAIQRQGSGWRASSPTTRRYRRLPTLGDAVAFMASFFGPASSTVDAAHTATARAVAALTTPLPCGHPAACSVPDGPEDTRCAWCADRAEAAEVLALCGAATVPAADAYRWRGERDAARETADRLHRRCQRLEAGVSESVERARRGGGSLGRMLANAAAEAAEARAVRAEAEVGRLRGLTWEAGRDAAATFVEQKVNECRVVAAGLRDRAIAATMDRESDNASILARRIRALPPPTLTDKEPTP